MDGGRGGRDGGRGRDGGKGHSNANRVSEDTPAPAGEETADNSLQQSANRASASCSAAGGSAQYYDVFDDIDSEDSQDDENTMDERLGNDGDKSNANSNPYSCNTKFSAAGIRW